MRNLKAGFHVHSNITEKFLHVGSGGVPNRIDGLILFKKNPFSDLDYYDGFREFSESKKIDGRHW